MENKGDEASSATPPVPVSSQVEASSATPSVPVSSQVEASSATPLVPVSSQVEASSATPSSPVLGPIPIKPKIMLNDNNYLAWKSYVTNEFIKLQVHYMINGTYDPSTKTKRTTDAKGVVKVVANPKYLVLDQRLLEWMQSMIPEEIKERIPISSLVSSRDLWLALEKEFATQSKALLMELRSKFRSVRQDTPSISEYLQHVENIVAGYERNGTYIPKEDLVLEVLAGLGPEYEFKVSSTKRTEEVSYEVATEFLSEQKTAINAKTLENLVPIVSSRFGNEGNRSIFANKDKTNIALGSTSVENQDEGDSDSGQSLKSLLTELDSASVPSLKSLLAELGSNSSSK